MAAWVAPAVGALTGIAGGILGASGASKAREKQNALINAEDKRNEDWFNREYYKSQLDRTENARALEKAHSFIKDRSNMDRKSAAITGATPESTAASKKQYMNAYSDLVGNIAAQGSAARDRIYNTYNQGKQNIFGLRNGLLENQVQQYGNMSANAANTGTNSAMALVNQFIK